MSVLTIWTRRRWLWIIAPAVALAALAVTPLAFAQPSAPDIQGMLAACQAAMAQFGGAMAGMMGSTVGSMMGMMGSMGGMGLR